MKKSASKTNKNKASLVKVIVLEDLGKWISPDSGSKFNITDVPIFPDITFMIETTLPGPYNWKWSIQWAAKVSGMKERAHRGALLKTFSLGGAASTDRPQWKADLGKIVGGTLTVEITVGEDHFKRSVYVVAENPSKSGISAFVATISDAKGFARLLEQESDSKNFINADGNPIVSFDRGYGITQITSPAPTYEQTWNWKENIRIGARLYRENQLLAKKLLGTHPPYTDDMLELETYARWNGGSYYEWSAERKAWAVRDNVLCDTQTGNMGWSPDIEANTGQLESVLHARDKESYKKGKTGQTAEHPWKYSGICYANHVKSN